MDRSLKITNQGFVTDLFSKIIWWRKVCLSYIISCKERHVENRTGGGEISQKAIIFQVKDDGA